MKLDLRVKANALPRNKAGDVQFTKLGIHEPKSDFFTPLPGSVLSVFTFDEVVELVNRALYQLEYQARAHAKRQRRQTEELAPVKRAAKRVYPNLTWSNLGQAELKVVMERLAAEPSLGEEVKG